MAADCVYFAWRDLMNYYGLVQHPNAYQIFKTMKQATLPDRRDGWALGEDGRYFWASMTYTYGGVSPWIIRALAHLHGLDIAVQHRMWTPEVYVQKSETPWQEAVSIATAHKFGKEVVAIDLEPAMYFMLDGPISLHAQFFEHVPVDKGVCVMAIALTQPIPHEGVAHERQAEADQD